MLQVLGEAGGFSVDEYGIFSEFIVDSFLPSALLFI